jgi:hypothetical protein
MSRGRAPVLAPPETASRRHALAGIGLKCDALRSTGDCPKSPNWGDVKPTNVDGVCDPVLPYPTDLTEAGYNAVPVRDSADQLGVTQGMAVLEPCPILG